MNYKILNKNCKVYKQINKYREMSYKKKYKRFIIYHFELTTNEFLCEFLISRDWCALKAFYAHFMLCAFREQGDRGN